MSITARQTSSILPQNSYGNRSYCLTCGNYTARDEINCPICGSFFRSRHIVTNSIPRPSVKLEVLTMDEEKKDLVNNDNPQEIVETSEQSLPQTQTIIQTETKSQQNEQDQMQKFKEELLQMVTSVSEFTKHQLNDLKKANEEGRFDNLKEGAKNISDGAVKYVGVAGDYIKDSSVSATRWVTDQTRRGISETQDYIETLQRKAEINYIYEPEKYPELTNLCKKLVLFAEGIRWFGYIAIVVGFFCGLALSVAKDTPPGLVIGRFFFILVLTIIAIGIHELVYYMIKAIPELIGLIYKTELNTRKILEKEREKIQE